MFSVLTLNLRFGLADDGPNNWQYRKQNFPTLLADHNADFFGFQEANAFQIEYLDSILNDYGFIGQRSPAPPFWQSNIIFFRKPWACVYRDHFYLSPTPTVPSRYRQSRWPRQCTMGIFKKNRHELICINTHFDFDASVQIKSAKLIMERLLLLPSDVPAILMGDFNASPSSPCHAIFTGKDQKPPDTNLYFTNAFKKPFPGTHHGFKGVPDSGHIDWILYRGRITLSHNKIIRDAVDGMYPSDHFPLYAAFERSE